MFNTVQVPIPGDIQNLTKNGPGHTSEFISPALRRMVEWMPSSRLFKSKFYPILFTHKLPISFLILQVFSGHTYFWTLILKGNPAAWSLLRMDRGKKLC